MPRSHVFEHIAIQIHFWDKRDRLGLTIKDSFRRNIRDRDPQIVSSHLANVAYVPEWTSYPTNWADLLSQGLGSSTCQLHFLSVSLRQSSNREYHMYFASSRRVVCKVHKGLFRRHVCLNYLTQTKQFPTNMSIPMLFGAFQCGLDCPWRLNRGYPQIVKFYQTNTGTDLIWDLVCQISNIQCLICQIVKSSNQILKSNIFVQILTTFSIFSTNPTRVRSTKMKRALSLLHGKLKASLHGLEARVFRELKVVHARHDGRQIIVGLVLWLCRLTDYRERRIKSFESPMRKSRATCRKL